MADARTAKTATVARGLKIRRFETTAALLDWTPTTDGQRARSLEAVDAGEPPDYEWLAEGGWRHLPSVDDIEQAVGEVSPDFFVIGGVPPDAFGADGDHAIDGDTGDFYEKTAGTWILSGAVTIPRIRTGAGAPSAALGRDGDWYFDTATRDMYSKDAGIWTRRGALAA